MEAGFPCDRARALVDNARVQAETGHQQEACGEEQDEQPVGERAGEQPTPDRRVPLNEAEPEVDRRVPRSGGVGAGLENPRTSDPAREPAGDVGSTSISTGLGSNGSRESATVSILGRCGGVRSLQAAPRVALREFCPLDPNPPGFGGEGLGMDGRPELE